MLPLVHVWPAVMIWLWLVTQPSLSLLSRTLIFMKTCINTGCKGAVSASWYFLDLCVSDTLV